MRRAELLQLYLVGFALVFLLTLTALGQSQDSINATVIERMNALEFRLSRVESYLTAAIIALIANFAAHLVDIKQRMHHARLREGPPR